MEIIETEGLTNSSSCRSTISKMSSTQELTKSQLLTTI